MSLASSILQIYVFANLLWVFIVNIKLVKNTVTRILNSGEFSTSIINVKC